MVQAEDGIRDPLVTGVQTCALPICIYPDNATAFPDNRDLLVADVALDVVKLSYVRVRNDERFVRKIDNVLESFWIDVSQIDEDAKRSEERRVGKECKELG